MNLRSLSLIVRVHGIVAMMFAFTFLLEAFGINLPMLSLPAQHPDFVLTQYTVAACLFAFIGILVFASYEIFILPRYLEEEKDKSPKSANYKRVKTVFVLYHIPVCVVVTYLAFLNGTEPSAYMSIGIMYGFTIWGIIAE